MSWIVDILHCLPLFLCYVVPGYLFISVYRYMLFKDEQKEKYTAQAVLSSIMASFVLKTLYELFIYRIFQIDVKDGSISYLLYLFSLSVILGYCSAKVMNSNPCRKFLSRIGINRTISTNIWDDVFYDGLWLHIWLKGEKGSYFGQFKLAENYSREPIVMLRNYQFLDEYENVVYDEVNRPGREVILNLKDFERIELTAPVE